MKKLEQFVEEINEQRGRPRKNPENKDGMIKPEDAPSLKSVKGLDADENDSGGTWDVDAPTDDDITKGIDKDELNSNSKKILFRLKAKKPFFVQGEAGWGKTSIIKSLAKKCGLTVLTVYVHQAEKSDLGGIPAPKKSVRGVDKYTNLMPEWAALMWDNPDVNFLLFFDELNQAQADVSSSLMPIVLEHTICGRKFNNFIVGAAGNYDYENPEAINDLGTPLLSRFGGIIQWKSGDWESVFKHLHKKWDDKISKDFLEDVRKYTHLFKNPRDVESFVIEYLFNVRESGDYEYFDIDDVKDHLKTIAKEKLSRTEEVDLETFAEICYNYMRKAEKKDTGRSTSGKDISMIPEKIRLSIKRAMENGYIRAGGINYGVSRENIKKMVNPAICNGEMVQRLIDKYEIDGSKFKYETDDEWKKAGYKETQNFIISKNFEPEPEPSKSTKRLHDND